MYQHKSFSARRFGLWFLALALLLSAAPSLSAQDLFDEADGGTWFASKSVSVTNGLLTSSSISFWRHPALGIAEVRVIVNNEAVDDPFVPNAIALKIDGEVSVVACTETDVDLGFGGLTSSTLMSFATCEMDYELSEALLQAKSLEVQISTVERRLKPEVLTGPKLAKLKALREQVRKR